MAEANYATSVGYDLTFELNEFHVPRLRSEAETLKNVLFTILFSKPGFYPSLPVLGLDIESRLYDFYDEINVDDLKNQIREQCEMLGHYISAGNIDIVKMKYREVPSLFIIIDMTEEYPVGYNNDSKTSGNKYLIGISYDELQRLQYNIKEISS